jgi:hypothetical protein
LEPQYAAYHQPLATTPVSGPSKPPQKTTRLAGKTIFSQNYFSVYTFTFPSPTRVSPFFYGVFVAVLAPNFALKIVPTVGMTNLETML